ncbi:MAG: tryptophan synthase subunit alpha [Enterobacterales bacterium]
MKRYKILFNKLLLQNELAFVPFITLGDPNFKFSISIIENLIKSGADALEFGIPFSDPIADGPIIQKSMLRSIKSGITLNKCFEIISIIRKKYKFIPIGLLMYANLIFNHGVNKFYKNCNNAGVDSVLIADIPIEESEEFHNKAILNNIDPVYICPPNADKNLLKNIALKNKSYIYLLSRLGVTGKKNNNFIKLDNIINILANYNSVPILQGFGISTSKQVKIAMKSKVSGVILGSAIIRIIELNINDKIKMLSKLNKFVTLIKSITKKTAIY